MVGVVGILLGMVGSLLFGSIVSSTFGSASASVQKIFFRTNDDQKTGQRGTKTRP